MSRDEVQAIDALVEKMYGPLKPHKPRRTAWVYFVQAGDLVKIGHSSDPIGRLEAIRTHNPDAELLAVERGGIRRERQLHADFASLRFKREWFHLRDELEEYVSSISKSPEQKP